MNTNYKTGLSSEEVINSRKKYGSNKLEIRKKNSFLKLVFESLNDPIIKMLLIALCIKILFLFRNSNIYETIGIAISVFLASFISAISEYGSEKAFEKLSEENNHIQIKVIRNNKKEIVDIDEVVVGDIVILESGDRIPADGIIINGECSTDESMLSGESKEKLKEIGSHVYKGSVVLDKKALMIVKKVGKNTFYGKISDDIQEKNAPSPLKEKLTRLAKIISLFGYIGALLVFISYMYNAVLVPYNYDFSVLLNKSIILPHLLYALTLCVAVVVMAVPEGLPMMITLVLSSNMKRLLKKNVLVRKLVGIETSGSLNVLFTDKTGTLTEGKLKVIKYISPTLKEYNNIENNYDILYQSMIYNNESFFINNKVEGGNITDKAILEFINSDNKNKYKILNKKIFNSKLKYSSVTTNYNNQTTFYKGAYEVLINKVTRYLDENGKEKILLDKKDINNYIYNITKKGNRIITLAMSKKDDFENLTLVGFLVLKDKIRKDAYEAVNLIKKAGIDIIMVTGDAKETAESIAKELKIIDSENDIVLTSEEFNRMNDEDIKKILPNLKVLSRSLPEDKNRLVKISKELDLVVGMTGDGVNDAPALKRSDVGFSMGSGSEVAKETSDIVIIDNNISSIAVAILYGRTIFKSIRKYVVFQLSVNLCSVMLSIIGPFIGVLSPITVIQVLWVNMVMDTFAGLAFSFEPAFIEYMNELPKNKNTNIINSYMKNQIFFDGLFSMIISVWFLKSNFINEIYKTNISDKYMMTAFFGLFIFIDIFNAFNARTSHINTFYGLFKNKIFIIIFTFIMVVQIILIYFGGELFRTTGLTIYEFEIMIIVAFLVIPFDILRKILLKIKRAKVGF